MKTTLIILSIVAFLWVCVSMARDKRDAETLPQVSSGLTYSISKDKFEVGVDRYEMGVQLNEEASQEDVMKISDWIRRTRNKSSTFIIFYYVPEMRGAWARVDYASTGSAQAPEGKFELMPVLED